MLEKLLRMNEVDAQERRGEVVWYRVEKVGGDVPQMRNDVKYEPKVIFL